LEAVGFVDLLNQILDVMLEEHLVVVGLQSGFDNVALALAHDADVTPALQLPLLAQRVEEVLLEAFGDRAAVVD